MQQPTNRLPKQNRNELGLGRDGQRLDHDILGLQSFVGRLSSGRVGDAVAGEPGKGAAADEAA